MSTVPEQPPTALPEAAAAPVAALTAATTTASTPSQPSSPDAKKVGSDGEDFSDTANETGTFELCSDANKTATSSSHQDSEYDTASDSQSSDEADPLHKPEPAVTGDTVGGDTSGGGGVSLDADAEKTEANTINSDDLVEAVTAKASIMQLSDDIPIEEKRKISHEENDIHDDADGEADDDDECLNRRGRRSSRGSRGSRSGDSEDDDEDDDDDDRSDDDIRTDDESESDNGSIILDLDLERQRGDGEEEQNEEGKKVDDDEDRSNPQYIPKRGVFYEHDDRTADDPDANSAEVENGAEEQPATPAQKKISKKSSDRWCHDAYDESEQAPKSRAELVNSYGYDIRNEDGPPKTRRNRRYNRGPMKYTRKWEDESAYAKQTVQNRNPRPEDFPELGSKGERRSKGGSQPDRDHDHDREEKENRSVRQNYQSGGGGGSGDFGGVDDDDNRNYSSSRRRNSNRDRGDRDRQMGDRRDSDIDRRDRRDIDRRDSSRSRRQQDRYSSRGNRSDRGDLDDRRKNRDKGYKTRPGREFKNQNRNKNNDYDVGRPNNTMYNRNNGGNHSELRNPPHHHQQQQEPRQHHHHQQQHHDDEHVESVSFTNSKLNNNSNRFSNMDYANVGSNMAQMQNRDYGLSAMGQEQQMQQHQQQHQQQPNQQSQSQQRFQLVSNEIPINLESANQMPNQQNSQSTLLTTNHSLPISSSVIASTGAVQMNQQALHGQPMNQVPQSMVHLQGAPNSVNSLNKGHVKRYSNQRQRTGLEAPPQGQGQGQPPQQLPIMMQQQQQAQQQQQQQQQQPQPPPQQQPPNPLQGGAHQTPQPGVVPNVSAPAQFQPNYFPNDYPAINQLYVSDIRQQPSGPAAGYLPQGAPPQTVQSVGASVGVVPQMMNFVAAHPPLQQQPLVPAPVVQPVPNAQVVAQPPQGQYPSFPPYAGVQNYNSASGITYYAPQTQAPPRPILSQRRHKNAIPIMAPPERSIKHRSAGHSSGAHSGSHSNDTNNNSDQQQQQAAAQQSVENSAENIDHILDNMFVQRPHPYQSATGLAESAAAASRKDPSPPNDSNVGGNAYASEHDPSASKDDAPNSEQVAQSFGDMNISVAIQAKQ